VTTPLERDVLAVILDYLNTLPDTVAWRNNTGAVSAEYKGKRRFIRYGVRGGADVFSIQKGRFIAVEVKRQGKKPTPDQAAFLEMVREHGGVGIWADSLEMLVMKLGEEQ
jgi:hypothetical protein